MSVLNEMYAVPARIAAVFKYLLSAQGHIEPRDELENLLSPVNLRSEDGKGGQMVKKVIDECLRMGLVKESERGTGRTISLAGSALDAYGGNQFDRERFRDLLTRMIISDDTTNPNEDLCTFLAWYLAQDIYTMGGNWDWMNQQLSEGFGQARRGFTEKTQWNHFGYWAIYLGLAWRCGDEMFPDPSRYISRQLQWFSQILPQPVTVARFLEELTKRCPIFAGGLYYNTIKECLPRSQNRVVCSTVSLALMRLEEHGMIRLIDTRADADVALVRVSAKENIRYDRIEIK